MLDWHSLGWAPRSALTAAVLVLGACATVEDEIGDDYGAGGSTTGGAWTGGMPSGGADSGGTTGTGGDTGTGAATNTGGVDPLGGALPTGGLTPTGGIAPTGGISPDGGMPTGGAGPTGGARPTGGATPTGGQEATGGKPSIIGQACDNTVPSPCPGVEGAWCEGGKCTCGANQIVCDDACTYQWDSEHCGDCDTSCTPPSYCQQGTGCITSG